MNEIMHQNDDLTTARLADICISKSVDFLHFIEFEKLCYLNNWIDLIDSCTIVRESLKRFGGENLQFFGIVSPLYNKDYPYILEYSFYVDITDNVYTSFQIVYDTNKKMMTYQIIDFDHRFCVSSDETGYSIAKSSGPFLIEVGFNNQEMEELIKRYIFKIQKLNGIIK